MLLLLLLTAWAAEPRPIHWDCYLPDGAASCDDLAARLLSGAFRVGDAPDAISTRIRSRNQVEGVQSWDIYEIDIAVPEGTSQHTLLRVHTGVDSDIAEQRLHDHLLASLAVTQELQAVSTGEDGSVTVTWGPASVEEGEDKPPKKEQRWYLAPSIWGDGNYAAANVSVTVGGDLYFNYSTPSWRLKLGGGGSLDYQKVKYGSIDDVYQATWIGGWLTAVRTLKNRWSMALLSNVDRSTGASNLDLSTSTALGVEYNIHPFQTGSNEGNFTLRYKIGLQYDNFQQRNILGDLDALYPEHSLDARVSWHFDPADISLSVGSTMNLLRPEFSSVDGWLSADLRLSPVVTLSPWLYTSFQNAQISQPRVEGGGTLDELRAAGMWNQFELSGGLSFGFVLGNAQLEQTDQRW